MTSIAAVRLLGKDTAPVVSLLDQRLLPTRSVWLATSDAEAVANAITDMVVRGAPAIGITAAYGLLLAMAGTDWPVGAEIPGEDVADADAEVLRYQAWSRRFAATRPTAVNLFWAIERMDACFAGAATTGDALTRALRAEAIAIHDEDRAYCLAMGRHGAALLPQSGGVLTHCNTGALATGGIGTALGVLRVAIESGKQLHVWVDETRPYLQGARLTAWECVQDGLPATLISDNMAGWMMQQGKIAAAIVGSDRIAQNGDVCNKIGTYSVAVLCKHHGIPFYVAAPTSTIDLDCHTGAQIPIEQRSPREVTHVGGWAPAELIEPLQVAPEGIGVANPAFDVVPADLVTAIITEQGVAQAPYPAALAAMVQAAAIARQR